MKSKKSSVGSQHSLADWLVINHLVDWKSIGDDGCSAKKQATK